MKRKDPTLYLTEHNEDCSFNQMVYDAVMKYAIKRYIKIYKNKSTDKFSERSTKL